MRVVQYVDIMIFLAHRVQVTMYLLDKVQAEPQPNNIKVRMLEETLYGN